MNWGVVGVDVGGTNTVLGIFDSSLSLLDKISIPTVKTNISSKTNNPAAFFDVLEKEITQLVIKNGYKDGFAVSGLAFPER